MGKFNNFEDLRKAKFNSYLALQESDDLGFLDQHTGFYPNPAHFIYELLQNAEDMNASQVTFQLYEDKLIFEHDGTKRDFNIEDIEAITSKGKSPKANDPTQIGRFGMGFKAVYVYTNTPEIHSGQYHFKIRNVIVPDNENISNPIWIQHTKQNKHTQFIFPFDNPQKSADNAVKEIIEEGFYKLNETALLFLTHIETIQYYLPDGSNGYIFIEHKISNMRFIDAITVKKPLEDKTVTYWAKFSDECPLMMKEKGSNNKAVKSFPVSIAYKLIKKDEDKFSLDSSLVGKVCLFFPTEMDSLLHFHINAPFASTVARDVILSNGEDGEANDKLINKLADLTAESLHCLKKANMLDYDAYSTLPTLRDYNNQPNSRYKIFATRIKEEFENAELFITDSGTYRSMKDVYNATNRDIKTILPNEYIEKLYQRRWIPTVSSVTRIEYFIDQFDINGYSIENFIDSLEKDPHFFDELLSNQNDAEYFKTLYYLLSQSKDRESNKFHSFLQQVKPTRNEILRKVKFLMCEDGVLRSAKDTLFLRTAYQPKHYLINPIYLDISLKDSIQDGNVKRFLLSLGIKEMSESVDMNAGLSNDNESVLIVWLDILKQFEENPESILQYKDQEIFLARKPNDSNIFRVCAKNCCWSKEIAFFYNDKYIFAEDCYSEIKQNILEIKKIFIKFGGIEELKIIRTKFDDSYPLISLLKRERERSDTCVRIDYVIAEFGWNKLKDIKTKSLYSEALILWKLILRFNNRDVLYIVYKANASANEQNNLESSLVYYLKRMPWVPTKSGTYKCPYELTDDDLFEEFKYETPSLLLKAISKRPNDIVEQLKNTGIEDKNVLEFAGMDPDVREQALAFAKHLQDYKQKTGKSLSELAATSDREQSSEENEDDNFGEFHKPKNLDKRRLKLEKEFDDREEPQTSIKKLRFVLEKPVTEEKIFVKNEYCSHCQICGEEGILTAKGKRYFEAINIFNTGKLDKDLQLNLGLGWNTLCLCPNCAAKFKYSQLTISSLIEQAQSINIDAAQSAFFDISISLEGKPTTIRFTPKHLLALQVAVKKIKELESSSK